MTGTRVEIERVTCNKEMKVIRTLAEIFYEEMTKIPGAVLYRRRAGICQRDIRSGRIR